MQVPEQSQSSFSGWAKVEVLGHNTHIGYVRTEAYGQAVMFRIDTPDLPEREYTLEDPAYVDVTGDGGERWCTAGTVVKRVAQAGGSVLVGAGSIYRIIPCDEAAAMRAIEMGQRPKLKLVKLAFGAAIAAPEPDDNENDEPEESEGDF